MPEAGAARGRSPRPAPLWLHQFPLWILRSTRDWSTNVLGSVDVLGPVGRFGPPQPLRDVSISMPMFALNPAWISRLRNACANVSSSLYRFQSIHRVLRNCSVTGPTNGSVSAE